MIPIRIPHKYHRSCLDQCLVSFVNPSFEPQYTRLYSASTIGIGALGLGLGIARDKFGKRVGRNILQKLRTIPKEVDPMDYGSPTAAQLQKMAVDMATGGNKKLAATYYVLSQRNENLRKKKDE